MRKKFLVIMLTAIIFLSGATLGVSTVYRINEVTLHVDAVSREAETEAEQLREDLLKAYEKRSSFFVEESVAFEIVERFPYFRMTGFEKAYPNRLIVRLSEDEEVYAVQKSATEYYILNGEGVVLSVRDNYVNRSETSDTAKNVLLAGIQAVGEKGNVISGDNALGYLLPFCQKVSTLLNGIRRNIVKVELLGGNGAENTVMLALTTREGVKIYVRNPALNTQAKAEKAVEAYLGVSDVERTTGMIAVYDGAESVQSTYTPIDEFVALGGIA